MKWQWWSNSINGTMQQHCVIKLNITERCSIPHPTWRYTTPSTMLHPSKMRWAKLLNTNQPNFLFYYSQVHPHKSNVGSKLYLCSCCALPFLKPHQPSLIQFLMDCQQQLYKLFSCFSLFWTTVDENNYKWSFLSWRTLWTTKEVFRTFSSIFHTIRITNVDFRFYLPQRTFEWIYYTVRLLEMFSF